MIDFAFAADGAAPSALMQFAPLAPLVLILLVFYFLIMRPQQKKFKAHQQMLSELKKGDKIITSSGIAGRITKVGEQFFSVEIAPNVEVEIERNAITSKATA
jgi:preprotein translocase subunit YajC